MSAGAGVNSVAVLHDWYAALAAFRTDAQDALTSLSLELQRSSAWLGEQQQSWQRQVRAREEDVTQARTELRNRQYRDGFGQRPDTTVEEKNLRRAQARLQAAEERLEAVRRWTLRLPHEICANFDGPANRLALFLDADLPAGLALLARQLTALEQYANLRADTGSAPAVESKKEPS